MLSGVRPGSCSASLAEDGAYASWANLQLCQDLGIRPDIPLRTGPIPQLKSYYKIDDDELTGHTPENRPYTAGKGGWAMHGACMLWNN